MLANRPDTIAEPVYYKQILTYSVIVVAGRSAARLGRPRAAGLVTHDGSQRTARRTCSSSTSPAPSPGRTPR